MQSIYDAIDAELTVQTASDGGLARLRAALSTLLATITGGTAEASFVTVDASGVRTILARVTTLDAALADVGGGSVIGDALRSRLGEIAGDAAESVRSLAPVDTGLLRDFGVRSEVQDRKRALVARVLAHARGTERYNYAWFTELGTQDHAVDAIGYVDHGTRATGTHRGIPAQHWFERGVHAVFDDAEQVIASTLERVVSTVLGS